MWDIFIELMRHKCKIGIYFDAWYHVCTEEDIKEMSDKGMNWHWLEMFNYCPVCGKKINWEKINKKYKGEDK